MSGLHSGTLRAALFVSVLAAGRAGAQPHASPPPAPEEAVVTPDPDVWLGQLVGRFRFDGAIHHEETVDDPDRDETDEVTGLTVRKHTPWHLNSWTQPIQGKADCIAVGDGPGLQCVVNVIWPEMWRSTGKAQLGGVSDMSPAVILAGLAPTSGGIRVLLVDHKGLAHPGSTTLSGDSANSSPPCVNTPGVQRCKQTVKLTAKPGAAHMYLVISTGVYFRRDKTDRKQFLEKVEPNNPYSPMENSMEWVEEDLDVSFSLQRESQAADGAAAVTPPASR